MNSLKNSNFVSHIQNDLKYRYQIKATKTNLINVINVKNQKRIGILTKDNQFYEVLFNIYHLSIKPKTYLQPQAVFFNFKTNTIYLLKNYLQTPHKINDDELLGLGTQRKMYQELFNQIPKEPKPMVETCILLNSKKWSDNKTDMLNLLRIDGIKIFFDHYEAWWLGL